MLREKTDSKAEVDFIYQFENKIIPIEVKAGASGKLRSLFEFIDIAHHNLAIRIYSGKLSIDKVSIIKGKEFYLLNLPFYLISQIDEYLKMAYFKGNLIFMFLQISTKVLLINFHSFK